MGYHPVMLWLLLAACESIPTSGHLFEPVAVTPRAAAAAPAAAPSGADPRFAEAEPFRISSEEMAGGGRVTEDDDATAPADEALSPADAAIAGGGAPGAPAAAAPGLPVAPAAAQFPVRLVSTLPQAQPPRAVLGLPDGSEVVVAPGTVLGPQGLVVMAVMDGRVQLARVTAAGDHAVIQDVELSAQYP